VLNRRTSGSVVCPSCGSLVGVRDDKCYSCGRSNPGLWGFGPALRAIGADFGFAPLVIGSCSVTYALMLLASGSGLQVAGGAMSFLVPSQQAMLMFGASGAFPVFVQGHWWTLLTASWLHGSFLHILFNMMWVRDLGPALVEMIGAPRTVIVYIVSGICGFLLSSAMPYSPVPIPFFGGAPLTLGASASVLGLLGALLHYGRKSGSRLIHSTALNYVLILFVMGLFMRGVDNTAHLGGFLGGYGVSALFNPLTREKGDHLIIALVLLAATFLALVYSVFTALPIGR
jgi:rhomboid protease GluP